MGHAAQAARRSQPPLSVFGAPNTYSVLKVCYQAGVLQVWLDEAGLTFDHADGASGGTFNLAMYCQGMSGKTIADNWRTLDPFLPVDVNLSGLWPFSRSLFTTDSLRAKVLPFWH
jgi:hypothetical protein